MASFPPSVDWNVGPQEKKVSVNPRRKRRQCRAARGPKERRSNRGAASADLDRSKGVSARSAPEESRGKSWKGFLAPFRRGREEAVPGRALRDAPATFCRDCAAGESYSFLKECAVEEKRVMVASRVRSSKQSFPPAGG